VVLRVKEVQMGLGTRVGYSAEPSGTSEVVQLIERYKNAYRVAESACHLGAGARVFGAIAGVVVLVLSAQTAASYRGQTANAAAAIVVGFSALALFWLLGTLISTLGENLKASLDTAVYTSTFLDNVQRAKIMSLK
jgi:hypothetical protein